MPLLTKRTNRTQILDIYCSGKLIPVKIPMLRQVIFCFLSGRDQCDMTQWQHNKIHDKLCDVKFCRSETECISRQGPTDVKNVREQKNRKARVGAGDENKKRRSVIIKYSLRSVTLCKKLTHFRSYLNIKQRNTQHR